MYTTQVEDGGKAGPDTLRKVNPTLKAARQDTELRLPTAPATPTLTQSSMNTGSYGSGNL